MMTVLENDGRTGIASSQMSFNGGVGGVTGCAYTTWELWKHPEDAANSNHPNIVIAVVNTVAEEDNNNGGMVGSQSIARVNPNELSNVVFWHRLTVCTNCLINIL
jgi:hypothetical protein